jgi:Domain of unknown function (DUF4956)
MHNGFWLVLTTLSTASLAACGGETYSLVDRLPEAEKDFSAGRYPSFLDATADHGPVELTETTRVSLTPPFPSVLRFDVTLPDAAFITLAPALSTREDVRRARVEFLVVVEADGERTTALAETLRHVDANRWHDRTVDLTRFSGRRVVIELATQAPGGRSDMTWADRVQTVWGEPTIRSSRGEDLAAAVEDLARRANDSFSEGLSSSGVGRDELSGLYRFTASLLLGGLMSLGVRELYRRYGSSVANRAEFGNLFPIFTLSTIVLISVVRTSLALSLGLLGALSIVRFRAAIKTPEQIVYLLLCVLIGLALGAEQPLLAVTSALVVSAYIVGRSFFRRPVYERNFLLRVSGEANHFFGSNGASAADAVRSVVRHFEVQRLEQRGDAVEMSGVVTVDPDGATTLPQRLRERLPHLHFSCVDVDEVF